MSSEIIGFVQYYNRERKDWSVIPLRGAKGQYLSISGCSDYVSALEPVSTNLPFDACDAIENDAHFKQDYCFDPDTIETGEWQSLTASKLRYLRKEGGLKQYRKVYKDIYTKVITIAELAAEDIGYVNDTDLIRFVYTVSY